MKKQKAIVACLAFLIIICIDTVLFRNALPNYGSYYVEFYYSGNGQDEIQIFYSNEYEKWTEENSIKVKYVNKGEEQLISCKVPANSLYLRFDFGQNNTLHKIKDVELKCLQSIDPIESSDITNEYFQNQIVEMDYDGQYYTFITEGSDPYIVYHLNESNIDNIHKQVNLIRNIIILFFCLAINIIVIFLCTKYQLVLDLLYIIYKNINMIWRLAKNDFRTKYAGSYLGMTWAFVQPVITILVYWFVFAFGLRSTSPVEGVPYILWFISALIPWFFFQEGVNNTTNCMVEYSYLVKKVVFKIEILPVIKLLSSLFVHFVFLIFTIIIFVIYGKFELVYFIQCLYYMICAIALITGLAYITSSVYLFFKDLGQIISIVLQILMWMTPILWPANMLKGKMSLLADLNPIFYITEGYRDSLINHIYFWQKPISTIYFWLVTSIIFIIGQLIYRRLKQHFADVL